jgi:hypothetical protein
MKARRTNRRRAEVGREAIGHGRAAGAAARIGAENGQFDRRLDVKNRRAAVI